MKVRDEIRLYADKENKPCLNWLFGRYHMQSQWMFVAHCVLVERTNAKLKSVRMWAPTAEGRILYENSTII